MGIDPEFMKTIDAARDDSVNLRVGVLNQSIVDTHGYSLEAVLTNVDTGEETHLVGTELSSGLGVKYDIPVELVSKRSKYLLNLGNGHVVSVYVTKRSIEHVLTNSGVFYFAGAASDGEGDEDMAFIINDVDGTLDKTWKEIKEAFLAGKSCIVYHSDDNSELWQFVVAVSQSEGISNSFTIRVITPVGRATYEIDAETGYPTISEG